jgi:hypothetical protein
MIEFPKDWSTLGLHEKIQVFINLLPQLTKEESDFISRIVRWDSETTASFILAKHIFEDDLDEM